MLEDFNTKRPTWSLPTIDTKKQQVEDMPIDLVLTIINDKQNTYLSRTTVTETSLDITDVSFNIVNKCIWTVLNNVVSIPHFIITKLTIHFGTKEDQKRGLATFEGEFYSLLRLGEFYSIFDDLSSIESSVYLAKKTKLFVSFLGHNTCIRHSET